MDLSPDEDHFQGRLLHQAALWDNVELVQELLSSGADADAPDLCHRTALHAAALAERSRCLSALLAAGANVDARCDDSSGGKTALHIAAERGHMDNVKVLIAAGADLWILDASGNSALGLAEKGNHRHAALVLLQARDAIEREHTTQHTLLRDLLTRGEVQQLRAKLTSLGKAAGIIVNLTPNGANTLLYVASEAGLTTAAAALLDAGADGRAHPATKYSPLYKACYHGHVELAKLLLAHFPEAVQQETVEKWLPLHAACMNGHANVVSLLLDYPYPPHLLRTYTHTDATGSWQYRFPFDVNALDARGSCALHAACAAGDLAVIDVLLNKQIPVVNKQDESQPPPTPPVSSPTRAGISLGIHAIVSKLTGNAGKNDPQDKSHYIRPVRVDILCGGDSCVARAARRGHTKVLQRLLQAGACAGAPAAAPPRKVTTESRDRRRSRSAAPSTMRRVSASPGRGFDPDDGEGPWTALAVAARGGHAAAAALLLQHGATDPHNRALRHCAAQGLKDLFENLLATKAYADPECKLNKSTMSESIFSARERESDTTLTYNALCPTTPVVVNWRELRCQLAHIRITWLRAAVLRVNPKLNSLRAALHALTRIDVANNELTHLPAELFTLLSLRYLNAAQNKLERLPTASEPFEEDFDTKGRRFKKPKKSRPAVYSAPVLQELHLQDNRLEELPPELFSLPALVTLDVSNNKLRELSSAMWRAPSLKELGAALNHLKDLPAGDEDLCDPGTPTGSTASIASSLTRGSSFDSKPYSRSPSLEEESQDEEESIPSLGDRTGNAVCSEASRVHTWLGAVAATSPPAAARCGLAALDLSHNQLSAVPRVLACRAPQLRRLNMAYNSLRSMSYVTSYPAGLRQLDLSHNEITCWPSLPQVENFGSSDDHPLTCYCSGRGQPPPAPARRPRSGGSQRAQLLAAACPQRRHLRLEGLRTLILSNNMLTRIQLTTDDDGEGWTPRETDDEDDSWGTESSVKGRLLFPLLSMLDVSCNLLRAVPAAIHELAGLAVLNISGNKDITDLPPQMGLLSRLWNLNATGCSFGEPLRSMVSGGQYRSMHIVGYLKSVLQEAKVYSRMRLMLVGVQGIGKTSLLECLRQESPIQHRRKNADHWTKRMGNKLSRGNMSTVGVDIGSWTYERHRSQRAPVTFRTWDFAGQHEYYATHQYFLSRRSLYLVLWRVTDGRKGLAEAIDWLRSIQARAPGSPVIMVATHYDQVANSNLPESESPEALQRLIRSSIMGAPDADKLGLPKVLDSVEVSCSTRHNIRLLADIIYSVAYSIKLPGSKEPLLEQKVPATYLALEECVTALAHDLEEPVLRRDQYKRLVTQYMQQKSHRMFRDAAELHQATMFLHENGVLLHYDDATLRELYFIRVQWLCDVLAHVVTVREINPFANAGIMKVDDLAHVFKSSPALARGDEASSLAVSLLTKFELALCWDARMLLVPSLLPKDPPQLHQLPLRSRSWGSTSRWPSQNSESQDSSEPVTITGRGGPRPLRRLLILSYVPCGFWPRLIARLLAEQALAEATKNIYTPPSEAGEAVRTAVSSGWGWAVWRTGLRLDRGSVTLVSLREVPRVRDPLLCAAEPRSGDIRIRFRQEGAWCELDVSSSACVEILLPAQTCIVRKGDGSPIAGYQSLSLEPNPETLAKVLALISDHVDLLLEDWYPSLGTRFVHTSEGRSLITRVVPCPECLSEAERDVQNDAPEDPQSPLEVSHERLEQAFRRLELEQEPRPRLSEESRASDGDSGVGAESNTSSRLGSVEGVLSEHRPRTVHAWSVEECILCACTNATLRCTVHGSVSHRHLAPDTLLLDVEESCRARWEQVTLGAVVGRGAFGTVLAGAWRSVPVAVKATQPVMHHHQAYKVAQARWDRDPTAAACRAYCGLRQELSILVQLKHPHVVPLVAVCAAPLALLLELAPQGALWGVLRSYKACGARVGGRALRALAVQVARALEYLHARRIVYRDLKSENVLVWSLPKPAEATAAERSVASIDVHVKLADYGISRQAPPSGTKGFGGTEGFMAPEIMRYNGEEEYNEKVDCFSYGMLIYEIITLRQPFEGHEAVKEAILEGARPSLAPAELQYPCNFLETMRRCWASAPELRPSAAALVSICAAPECLALQDAAVVTSSVTSPAAACPMFNVTDDGQAGWEVWCGREALLASRSGFTLAHAVPFPTNDGEPVTITASCRVGNKMWLGDSAGRVSVYSASTCSLIWSISVHSAVGGAPTGISALMPLPRLQRVALALKHGRLFLVTSHRPEAEGSFVLTELGAATELCCLASVSTPLGCELWAGGDALYCYGLSPTGVRGADTLTNSIGRITLLAACDREPFVFLCCDPGVCIYQWSVVSRRQMAKLDCSRLVPCSESLQSIAIDQIADHPTTVLSLCVLAGCVYAGTKLGSIIVAAADTLRPLTVFRVYEQDVHAIIPLLPHKGAEGEPMLATLGTGYRPLVQRFAPPQLTNTVNTQTGTYCLLWRAGRWLPD